MPVTHLNSVVRLTADVPSQRLRRGDQGVVVSVWLMPGSFLFEVEFRKGGAAGTAPRALVRPDEIEVIAS